jgi:hypothetical protein
MIADSHRLRQLGGKFPLHCRALHLEAGSTLTEANCVTDHTC